MRLLAQASELDIETFFATSREYRLRLNVQDIETMLFTALHDVRSQIRRMDPIGGQIVNVVIFREAERLAVELGTNAGLEATILVGAAVTLGGRLHVVVTNPGREVRQISMPAG